MVHLVGNNLGKRQKELNLLVIDAAKKNVNFDKIKCDKENNDVDKLFKIDLASKYRNIDYIIDTLKCGDSLFISRCLKIDWLYDDEHSNIINPEYLDTKILPFMSTKMMWKTLKTIATHMKNQRAEIFYEFCLDSNMPNIADKFLPMTSEYFKLELLKKSDCNFTCKVKDFIGNSFALAAAYLKCKSNNSKVLYQLRYLYSVSDSAYLDLLELNEFVYRRFGIRITKEIVTKHKERVLTKPVLYLEVLNLKVLYKNLNCSNAKKILGCIFPRTVKNFWSSDFLKHQKDLLNLIPFEERLQFLKDTFASKYEIEMSELSEDFYKGKFDTLMTIEEREAWALKHLKSEQCILGKENEFVWYEYVNFKEAFTQIKKIIMRTSDPYKRLNILKVLTNSERSHHDLETVLNYYHDRHLNETYDVNRNFLLNTIYNHNCVIFDDNCWNAFNKILYSLKIYDPNHPYGDDLKMVALIYYIINNKDLPDDLKYYFNGRFSSYSFMFMMDRLKLNEERKDHAYKFVLDYFVVKIKEIYDQKYNTKFDARVWIDRVLCLMRTFKKKADKCPEVVIKYMKLDFEKYGNHAFIKKAKPPFLCLLKKDAKLVVSDDVLKDGLGSDKLGTFFKKVKTYFAEDIAKEYEQYFIRFLSQKDLHFGEVYTVMFGIFLLGSDEFKNRIMMEYVPTAPKINHSNLDLLKIQESICRFAHYARPPVPLSNMLLYLKGDYVPFCLPMFGAYFTNLPKSQCIKFIEATLDTPFTIQKHSLRLAFQCFDKGSLKTVLLKVWKSTKNITLRAILYERLFNEVRKNETSRDELFDVLKTFTMDLNEKDDKKLFYLINIRVHNLPDEMANNFIQVAWEVVSKMSSDKISNYDRKYNIIKAMVNRIDCIDDDFLKPIVETHVITFLVEKQIKLNYDKIEINSFIEMKWNLVENYILKYKNKKEMETKLTLLKMILKICLDMWNVVYRDDNMDENTQETYTWREFCLNFIDHINKKSRNVSNKQILSTAPVIEAILIWLESSFRLEEIFLTFLNLKFSLICISICASEKCKDAKEFSFEFAKELMVTLGTDVGIFLKDLVEKFKSIPYFLSKIVELIYSYGQSMIYTLFPNNCVYSSELKLFLCVGLTSVNTMESYYIALNLLSLDPPVGHEKDYENVLHKIKMFKDNTIQCCLYQKFNDDYKRRRYF